MSSYYTCNIVYVIQKDKNNLLRFEVTNIYTYNFN